MKPTFAVFDVDNTVLAFKSLFSFAEYFCRQDDYLDFDVFHKHIQKIASNEGREAANKKFFTLFAGVDRSAMQDLIKQWSAPFQLNGFPVVEACFQAILNYQQQGTPIIWLSGSADIFLEPFAQWLQVEHVIASQLGFGNGYCSGETEGDAVIGTGKWTRLQQFLDRKGWSPADGIGFGDHSSDAAFLSELGSAIIVAGDDDLEKLALQKQWPIVSAKTIHYLPETFKEFS